VGAFIYLLIVTAAFVQLYLCYFQSVILFELCAFQIADHLVLVGMDKRIGVCLGLL